MNKTEKALATKEIRNLKAALNTRQKQTAREVKKRRDIIRANEREIAQIERESQSFVTSTTDRLAVLEGRLSS
jgi:phage host-nuclease inhibitor protein Gam